MMVCSFSVFNGLMLLFVAKGENLIDNINYKDVSNQDQHSSLELLNNDPLLKSLYFGAIYKTFREKQEEPTDLETLESDFNEGFYDYLSQQPIHSKPEEKNYLRDDILFDKDGTFKSILSKRRLPMPLGPVHGFPVTKKPPSRYLRRNFPSSNSGVQRRSSRRPTACSFGTFGLVCWNATLRKNRLRGGSGN